MDQIRSTVYLTDPITLPRGGGAGNKYIDSLGDFDFQPAWVAYTGAGGLDTDDCTGTMTVYEAGSGELVDRGTANWCSFANHGYMKFDLDVPGRYTVKLKLEGAGDLGTKSAEVTIEVVRG